MPMTGVLRLGHVALRVTDLEAACYRGGGIRPDRRPGGCPGPVYFKGRTRPPQRGVACGGRAGHGLHGLPVDSEATLDRLAAEVEGSRLATRLSVPAGEHLHTGRRFRFTVPTGHAIELFATKDKVGNGLPDVNPDPWPDGLVGMQPTRFDHCLLYGHDVDGGGEAERSRCWLHHRRTGDGR